MSKSIVIISLISAALAMPNLAEAQNAHGQWVVSVDAGSSLVGGAINLIIGDGEAVDTDTSDGFIEINNSKVSGGKALIVGFDYGKTDQWSIGGFFATQKRYGSTDFSYATGNGMHATETVAFNLRRNCIGFSTKFHYGKEDKVDLYSGVRLGMIFWVNSIESASGNFDLLDKMITSRPFFGLTAFGARVYPTKNIGLNFELNLGAPNVIGIGAVVKLN
jgi:hypothetical protein